MSMAAVLGCDSPKPTAKKIESRETIGKYTQEVRDLKPELGLGGQVTTANVSNRAFSDHRHCLVASQRPFGRSQTAEAQP